jgi:putative tryptophan/tyrosine transport system substrate-binding protein
MRRRDFVSLIGGSAVVWPLVVRAQQGERKRRVGVLESLPQDAYLAAFLRGLQQLGWADGHNVQIDTRWGAGNVEDIRKYAAELSALAPDVILAVGSPAVAGLMQAKSTVPIVFLRVTDPVGAGFVDSLARPGGVATGFSQSEYSISGKWLELLKAIAPGVTRIAVLRDPAIAAGAGLFAVIQSAAPSLRVEASAINVRDAGEIERTLTAFARVPNSGLIVTRSGLAHVHRDLIIKLAARHKLPAIYFEPTFVQSGGLMSYGPDLVDQYQRAASYVDRIIKGEKSADLPVQSPTKFQFVINIKTAKALGLDVPLHLQQIADEVIE